MDTTITANQTQKHHRSSIKSCIIESWKAFAYGVKDFFKYLSLHLLIAGLGFALFITQLMTIFTEYLQPVWSFEESGYDTSLAKALFAPSWTTWGTAAVAFIAFLLAQALMKGAIFSQIRFYKATDQLPSAGPFTFLSAIKQDAKKSFVFDLVYFGVLLVCSALLIVLAAYTSWWVCTALIPVWLYGLVISYNGRLQYIVENKPFKTVLKDAFKLGHHQFGGYLILLVLTGIPILVIAYMVCQPLAVIQFSLSGDMISHLAGDPTGIPPYVMPMTIVAATLGYSIYNVAFALQQWTMGLYTAAHCERKSAADTI